MNGADGKPRCTDPDSKAGHHFVPLSRNQNLGRANFNFHPQRRVRLMPARTDMSIAQKIQKELRMALLLNWRNRGYSRPHYGLVDDEELLRTGRSTFLSADGKQMSARRDDLLLLEHVTSSGPVMQSQATPAS